MEIERGRYDTEEYGYINWDREAEMLERLEELDEYRVEDGTPMYGDRHVIYSETSVNGGVCLGRHPREALVVDPEEDEELVDLYHEIRNDATQRLLEDDDYNRLRMHHLVASTVLTLREKLESDGEGGLSFVRENDAESDGEMYLGEFLEEGVGVCRHKALAAASVFEQFMDDDAFEGTVSVDKNSDLAMGHMWARYEDGNGNTYIIDPAGGFGGRAIKEHLSMMDWPYLRPSDDLFEEYGVIKEISPPQPV